MASPTRAQENSELAQDPKVRKYLNMLSAAEGADYDTAFGGGKIGDLSDHPRTRKDFTETTGKKNTSSAAGRYQFLEKTWDGLANKLGLKDFGPESQDIAAVELLRQSGSLKDIQSGDFSKAISKDNKTWASLPGSPYAQKTRTPEFVASALDGKVPAGGQKTVINTAPQATPAVQVPMQEVATAPAYVPLQMPVQEAAPQVAAVEQAPVMPQGNPWQDFIASLSPTAAPSTMPMWGKPIGLPQQPLPDFLAAIGDTGPEESDLANWGIV